MSLRIDKWLWAARFFKTRSAAQQAVEGGKVKLNGERVKPAKEVRVGDELVIHIGAYEWVARVAGLSDKRGSATIAQTLFEESPESIATRVKVIADLREMPPPLFRGRPTKKDRRTLEQWQRNAAQLNDTDN